MQKDTLQFLLYYLVFDHHNDKEELKHSGNDIEALSYF